MDDGTVWQQCRTRVVADSVTKIAVYENIWDLAKVQE